MTGKMRCEWMLVLLAFVWAIPMTSVQASASPTSSPSFSLTSSPSFSLTSAPVDPSKSPTVTNSPSVFRSSSPTPPTQQIVLFTSSPTKKGATRGPTPKPQTGNPTTSPIITPKPTPIITTKPTPKPAKVTLSPSFATAAPSTSPIMPPTPQPTTSPWNPLDGARPTASPVIATPSPGTPGPTPKPVKTTRPTASPVITLHPTPKTVKPTASPVITLKPTPRTVKPTASPVITPQPTHRPVRTISPTLTASDVSIVNATLTDRFQLFVYFSSPVVFVNVTTISDSGSGSLTTKRQACVDLFSSPVFDPSVLCRINGLAIVTDSLRLETDFDFSVPVVTLDGILLGVYAGKAPLPSQTTSILFSATLVPQIQLALQSSSCGNLYLSWAGTTGNGAKPLSLPMWIVSSSFPTLNAKLTTMLNTNLIKSTSNSVIPTMTAISRYDLDSSFTGATVSIQLQLTNWLGLVSTSTPISVRFDSSAGSTVLTINVLSSPSPVVPSIVPFGQPQFSIVAPTSPVSIQSDFYLQVIPSFPVEKCANASQAFPDGTKYPVWRPLTGPFPRGFHGFYVGGDQTQYMVLSGQLGVGTYTFAVQVSRFQNLTASVDVTIDALPTLLGGNRTVNIDENAMLSLDGSYANGSIYDIRWYCRQYPFVVLDLNASNASDALTSPDFFSQASVPCPSINGLLADARGSTVFQIPGLSIALDQVFLFGANLTMFRGGPAIASLPAYLLRTTAEPGFSLAIDPSTQPIAGKGKVNIQTATSILAQSQKRNVKYQWAQVAGDLDASILSTIDLTKSFIVLPANTLSAGETYSFRVNAKNVPNVFATITFIGNAPPAGGYLSVSPFQGGLAGQTLFNLQASYFEDEDLPITYSFLVAQLDCYSQNCFPDDTHSSLFNALTPFFPDPFTSTYLEYFQTPQTLGVVAQDSLGAASLVVMANQSLIVNRAENKTSADLLNDLASASSTPEDGTRAWTNILSALSNINSTSINTTSQDLVSGLSAALSSAQQAADFAPQRMSSLVIENRISNRIATDFSSVIDQSPQMLQTTVSSMSNVLDRAIGVLSSSALGEGEVQYVQSLTADTLQSSSQLLTSISTSPALSDSTVSVPQQVVSKLVQVQLGIPLQAQIASSDRYFSSNNIDSSFVTRVYGDFSVNSSTYSATTADELVVSPSFGSSSSFAIPSTTLMNKLDETNSSLAFASSVLYRVNPFMAVQNQSLVADGVSSLELFDAVSGTQLESFQSMLKIVMEVDELSALGGDPALSMGNFQSTRTVKQGNQTLNVTNKVFCGFYDYSKSKWSDYGCQIEMIDLGSISCACNHTTDYTAWIQTIQEIVLVFTDVSNFDNISDGAAVLGVLLAWIAGTALFYIWGIYLDDRDIKRRVRGILFSLKLRRLRDLRVRNRVFHAWRCEVMKQQGTLTDSGMPLPPALSSLVSIERRNRDALLPPPPEMRVDLSTTPRRLWHFFYVAVFRQHSLLNTIFLLDAFLTRPMRVLCGGAVILGEFFSAALFYNFDQDNTVTIGTQILIAILSVLVVSPVVALFVLLTRRVAAQPGAQRLYLQQMMVVLIAELGEDRRGGDVQEWAAFAKHVTWEDFEQIHRYQELKNQLDKVKKRLPTTVSSPANKEAIKKLQVEVNNQKQAVLRAMKRHDTELEERKPAVQRRDGFKSRKVLGGMETEPGLEVHDLPLSGNTSRWLESVSSGPSERRKKDKSPEKEEPAKEEKPFRNLFTPKPFHVETPHEKKKQPREPFGRRMARMFCAKPLLWLLRSRPANWNRVYLNPPSNDFRLNPKWIYLCYLILALYYGVAFFFVLSWGFRVKSAAVANWIPTVVLSIFIDIFVIQPLFIFVSFSLMNEIAYRVEGMEAIGVSSLSWKTPVTLIRRRTTGKTAEVPKFVVEENEAFHDVDLGEAVTPKKTSGVISDMRSSKPIGEAISLSSDDTIVDATLGEKNPATVPLIPKLPSMPKPKPTVVEQGPKLPPMPKPKPVVVEQQSSPKADASTASFDFKSVADTSKTEPAPSSRPKKRPQAQLKTEPQPAPLPEAASAEENESAKKKTEPKPAPLSEAEESESAKQKQQEDTLNLV